MSDTRQKDQQMISLYSEYIELIKNGSSEQKAIESFSYLHPISFSRLRSFIIKKEAERMSASKMIS